MNQAEMENALRALLAERAQHAPLNDGLAEQIIVQAVSGGGSVRQLHRPPLRRRSWTLPLLAVAAVAAVVAGTIGFVTHGDSSGQGHGIAFAPFSSHSAGRPGPAPTPSTPQSSTTAVAPAGVTYSYVHLDSTEANGATEVQLSAFKAVDLTFVGTNIWAMGSATCITTGVGRCSALVHSTDGVHWTILSSTPFNVADVNNCTDPCAQHIRFATANVGYIFGPSTLLMTTDAGRTWKTQPGGAVALETLDGNVIKVSESDGCPPGCTYTVQIAPVGSTKWTTVALPGPYVGDGVALSRTSHFAYLLINGNPAGGAQNEQSALLTSDDDGATWVNRGEVCRQNPGPQGEVDGTGLTGGSDGSIIVTCQPRLTSPATMSWVTVSTNGGTSFHRGSGTLPAEDPVLVGAGTARGICVQDGVLYCTHDGGASFAKAHTDNGATINATWLGFEDQNDGRALEIGGTATSPSTNLWTTHDGGATWMLTVGIG